MGPPQSRKTVGFPGALGSLQVAKQVFHGLTNDLWEPKATMTAGIG